MNNKSTIRKLYDRLFKKWIENEDDGVTREAIVNLEERNPWLLERESDDPELDP